MATAEEIAASRQADEARAAELKRQLEIKEMERKLRPGFLSSWNDRLTAFGTIVATFAAIASGVTTKKKGSTAFNAALIVGTWARNLVPGIASKEGDKAMRDQSLETARKWRQVLAQDTTNAEGWNTTLATLDDLIARAETVRKPAPIQQTIPPQQHAAP